MAEYIAKGDHRFHCLVLQMNYAVVDPEGENCDVWIVSIGLLPSPRSAILIKKVRLYFNQVTVFIQ